MKNLFTTIVASASILLSPSIANAGNSFSDHVNLFNTLKEVGVTPLINSAHCKDGDYGLYHTTAQLLVVCQENRTANGDQVKWTLNDLDTLRHESHHVVQDCNNGKVGDGKFNLFFNSKKDFVEFMSKTQHESSEIKRLVKTLADNGLEGKDLLMELEAYIVAANVDALTIANKLKEFCTN
tara:strand:- start:1 stop:543 length:543 start_codon:yes stop_codon:yes gene_type:complete